MKMNKKNSCGSHPASHCFFLFFSLSSYPFQVLSLASAIRRTVNRHCLRGKRCLAGLPEELIIEILCRLPVESVVKCILVCKK
uniref:F-box domain-containing protein n=1 Tax=Rhizophora mucronata TaxID=61149 RepID=A0A2P2IYX8_RHIMU